MQCFIIAGNVTVEFLKNEPKEMPTCVKSVGTYKSMLNIILLSAWQGLTQQQLKKFLGNIMGRDIIRVRRSLEEIKRLEGAIRVNKKAKSRQSQVICPNCGKSFNNPVVAVRFKQPGTLTIFAPGKIEQRRAFLEFCCPNCSESFLLEWKVIQL